MQYLFNKLDRLHIQSAFTRSPRFIASLIIAKAPLLTSHAVIKDNSYFEHDYVRVAVYNVILSSFFYQFHLVRLFALASLQIARFRYSDFRAFYLT